MDDFWELVGWIAIRCALLIVAAVAVAYHWRRRGMTRREREIDDFGKPESERTGEDLDDWEDLVGR